MSELGDTHECLNKKQNQKAPPPLTTITPMQYSAPLSGYPLQQHGMFAIRLSSKQWQTLLSFYDYVHTLHAIDQRSCGKIRQDLPNWSTCGHHSTVSSNTFSAWFFEVRNTNACSVCSLDIYFSKRLSCLEMWQSHMKMVSKTTYWRVGMSGNMAFVCRDCKYS